MNSPSARLPVRAILAALLAVLLTSPVGALPIRGLYSERIAVANESDSERRRAIREALESVVLKVTGDRRWLDHPDVNRAFNGAQRFVESISYSSETVPVESTPEAIAGSSDGRPAAGPEEDGAVEASAAAVAGQASVEVRQTAQVQDTPVGNQTALQPADAESPESARPNTREQRFMTVQFARSLVDEMLNNADIPVWDSNRPSVLVWMVLQNAAGERSLLSVDNNPDIIALLQDFADRRGLPLIFPLLDFADRQNLSEDQVWTFDETAIRTASDRYGADSILAARLHFTASGQLVGLWQLLFRDQVQTYDGLATELEAYLFEPLDRITSELAGYFAVVPRAVGAREVKLRIDGIDDLQAFANLMAYMRNLRVVEGVVPTLLNGERIELRLDVRGDEMQLTELISLDRDLLPVQSGPAPVDDYLHYRWTR